MQSLDLLRGRPLWRSEITFGHVAADGTPITQAIIDKATDYLKSVFGDACRGGRVSTEPGFFRSSVGCLIEEPSTCVWAYGRGENIPLASFRQAAALVASWLRQESVTLAILSFTGVFDFIEPTDESAAAD